MVTTNRHVTFTQNPTAESNPKALECGLPDDMFPVCIYPCLTVQRIPIAPEWRQVFWLAKVGGYQNLAAGQTPKFTFFLHAE